MKRVLGTVIILIAMAVAIGCGGGGGGGTSSGSSPAPLQTRQTHPPNWLSQHGPTFEGDWTQCVTCHGSNLRGGTVGVSCFSSACHVDSPANMPPMPPHAFLWMAPDLHGAVAKSNLAFCQACHGIPGTIQFKGGSTPTACETCHTAAHAHPTDWQGAGVYSHRTSGNRTEACSICHNVTGPSAGPDTRSPSCFTGGFTNGNGQARGCHANGPVASVPTASLDGAVLYANSCASCHGPLATSTKTGATAARIQAGISGNLGGMISLATLSAAQVQAIATALAPATPPANAPAAPTGVTAAGGSGQVTVSWSAVSGATSYNLYWSTTSGVTTATGTKITGAVSPYVHTGRAASTTYYYVVTAVNGSSESAASAQASAATAAPPASAPAAPTGVTAAGGSGQVTVSWSAVSGATSYNLYWALATGVTPATGTKITGAVSPYAHTGLSAGTTYYYVATAVNGSGEGAASAQVSAVTAGAALDGAALYATNCASCHNPLASSAKRKRTAAQTQSAINSNRGGMGYLSTLTAAEVQAIATALNF